MIVLVSVHLILMRGVSSKVVILYFDPISVVTVLLVLLRFTNGSQSHWTVDMCGYDVTRSFCAITGNFWPLSLVNESVGSCHFNGKWFVAAPSSASTLLLCRAKTNNCRKVKQKTHYSMHCLPETMSIQKQEIMCKHMYVLHALRQ